MGMNRRNVSWESLRAKALDVHARLWARHRKHPKATWQQLYDAVPNHYTNALSLRCAMKRLQAKGRVGHTINLTRSGFNAYGKVGAT